MEVLVNALMGLISMMISLAIFVGLVSALLGPNRIRRMARRVLGGISAVRETHAEFRATRTQDQESEPPEPAESPEPAVAEAHGAAPATTVTPDQARWAYYDTPTCIRRNEDEDDIRLQ